METSLVQQAFVVQFNFNGHHRWASCPLCLVVGPQKEKVLEHLNSVHVIHGQQYHLVEAHDLKNGLNTFWLAVCQFFPGKVKQTIPEQDKKSLDSMKKAGVLPPEVIRRIEMSINEAARRKQQDALAKVKAQDFRLRPFEKVQPARVKVTPKPKKKAPKKKKGGKK